MVTLTVFDTIRGNFEPWCL